MIINAKRRKGCLDSKGLTGIRLYKALKVKKKKKKKKKSLVMNTLMKREPMELGEDWWDMIKGKCINEHEI